MILFFDGFDYGNLSSTRWNINAPARSNVTFRTGTHSATGGPTRDIGQNLATVIVGAAFNKPSAGGLMTLADIGTAQLTILVTSGLAIEVRRGGAGGTLLGASANGVFPLNAWNYVEVKATINNTTGSVVVRINGVTVLTLTGVNTRNTANSFVNRYSLDGTSFIDDHYLADTTGSAPNNDLLGDIRVDVIYPNAAGDQSDFTPSAGVNYQNVDDPGTADGDTTNNSSATIGHRDLLNLQSPATPSGVVHAVQTHVTARKTDAGNCDIASLNKSGSTVTVGPTHTLGMSFVQYDGPLYETNPDTSAAFTMAQVQSLQAGYEVITA